MIILRRKREAMSQFGTRKVDFTLSAVPRARERVATGWVRDVGRKHSFAESTVFAKLKSVGFNGPIMVEGVRVGATAGETTAQARADREFLEKAQDATRSFLLRVRRRDDTVQKL